MARLAVVVVPRAARTEIVGVLGDALKIRLAAPPVDGAANEELIKFLAKKLGVARGDISIISGASGKRKMVEITGVTEQDIERLMSRAR